jgi:membrane protease YdiL (CAAX protease family)
MATQDRALGPWAKLPVAVRAIISGLLIALVAANVWPLFLLHLSVPLAAVAEVIFLAVYLWWASGGGRPRAMQAVRAVAFRRGRLSSRQWCLGIVAAVFFAATVHASIVLLFRFARFPVADFRRGYDFSFASSLPLKWLAIVVSATSAGICEETGFRGYMQRPIEQWNGAPVAILVSSFFFTVVHLTKDWALAGMVPIVFGAGILLGLLAWASESLIPCMIGHVMMDVGLFAYWWTGVAGDFSSRPISETGVDGSFVVACAVFAVSLFVVLYSISRLRLAAKGYSAGVSGDLR